MKSISQMKPTASDAASGGASVRLKGFLGDRLDAMVAHHVAAQDADYLTAPFLAKTEREGRWQTEFWGKWMHAAMPFLAYSGDERLRAAVERGLDSILASQEPDGYIGNYPDDLRFGEGWDVWGIKYTMMGLMHYYDYAEGQETTGKGQRAKGKGRASSAHRAADALAACRRLCDCVIAEIGPGGRRGREPWQTGNWSGLASSSILEPVVWLHRRTGERRYLDFASFLVRGMVEPAGGPRLVDLALRGVSVADRNGYGNVVDAKRGYVMKHNRSKAYEMMSCYQGLLDYRDAVVSAGAPSPVPPDDILAATVAAAEDIAREEINLAGGGSRYEAWFHGASKQNLPCQRLQETCVTTTWMRLCARLLEATGDPTWADRLERTFYNAYLAAMRSDGSEFAAYTPLNGSRSRGHHHCFMHTDCCNSNGPRGFLSFLESFFTVCGDVATFHFYGSALARGTFADGRAAAFDMYSLYPRDNRVRITSRTEGAATLRLRIPAWSARTEVRLNGEALEGVPVGGFLAIRREWRSGDVVEIAFDMPVVAHTLAGHVAFTRGPVLLARDSRFGDGDLSEPFRSGIEDGQTMPSFAPVASPSAAMWMAFSATLPIGPHYENPEGALPSAVSFCDYASAANEWTRLNYCRTWFPVEC